jgi:RND family efflux transporter MFP subunit
MPRPILHPLAASLVFLAAGCSGRAAPASDPEPRLPVRTAAVAHGPVSRPIRAAGVVAAKDERDLAFKVGGIVARVSVQEGAPVKKGQVLAALDVTEVAAAVRQAREGLTKAERDRERARSLRESEAIPLAAAEDAATAAAVARAALDSAEFNFRGATLVAPYDGWVDRRLAEPGEVVAPGRPILRVSGGRRGFVVRASVSDRDVLGLSAGDAAIVTLDARPGDPIPGRIAEIARSATRGTGGYEVEIGLEPRRARSLLAGLTARVEISRSVPAAAAVPLSAIQDGDGARGAVFVVNQGRARRVPVRIAFLQGELAVLAAGLEGVERVVTEGASRLADGVLVNVVP